MRLLTAKVSANPLRWYQRERSPPSTIAAPTATPVPVSVQLGTSHEAIEAPPSVALNHNGVDRTVNQWSTASCAASAPQKNGNAPPSHRYERPGVSSVVDATIPSAWLVASVLASSVATTTVRATRFTVFTTEPR